MTTTWSDRAWVATKDMRTAAGFYGYPDCHYVRLLRWIDRRRMLAMNCDRCRQGPLGIRRRRVEAFTLCPFCADDVEERGLTGQTLVDHLRLFRGTEDNDEDAND